MSNFWQSGTGLTPTGNPQDAFLKDFTQIPDNTTADAILKQFILVEKENKYTNTTDKFYQVTYKLTSGDYKNREVTQKIKCFNGTPDSIDRNLNMLKLIMQLCDFKPTHSEAPGDIELITMCNKMVSVKIREWSMPKKDGTGMIEGNLVSEVWKAGELATETGIKAEVVHRPTDSALNRNAAAKLPELDDGLPF